MLLLESPSGRLTVLWRWLARLGAGGPSEPSLEALEDLGDLFEGHLRSAAGTALFVDAQELPLEEVGLLKRWLDRVSGARLIIVGTPAESEGAQRLWDESQGMNEGQGSGPSGEKAHPAHWALSTDWLPWPPDILRLEALLEELGADSRDSRSPWGSETSGRTADSPTRRTTISPTEIEPGEDTQVAAGEEPERAMDPVSLELAELREIEFILGRPGPQNVEETPNLAQSPRPLQARPTQFNEESAQTEASPAEDPPAEILEEPLDVTSLESDAQDEIAGSTLADPLAAALEAAARRASNAPGHELPSRDEDEERVAQFLRGLDLDAADSPPRIEERKPAPEAASLNPQDAQLEEAVDQAIEQAFLDAEMEALDTREFEESPEALLQRTDEGSAAEAEEAGETEAPASAPERHAPWFRDQVADLADIAQRIELGLSAARSADFEATLHAGVQEPSSGSSGSENGSEEDHNLSERKLSVRLDELELEVLRLSQFTRTLGYLASPPAPGLQDLDLRSLVSEWVQTQAAQAGGSGFENGRTEGAPRFLLRVDEELQILSDKSLLTQAFDALFYVARRTTPPGRAIRVRVLRGESEAGTGGFAETTIEFERGLLEARTADEICRPYALRRVLPELGPNSLMAARSILEGQDGRIALEDVGGGRMAWRVRLPLSN